MLTSHFYFIRDAIDRFHVVNDQYADIWVRVDDTNATDTNTQEDLRA